MTPAEIQALFEQLKQSLSSQQIEEFAEMLDKVEDKLTDSTTSIEDQITALSSLSETRRRRL